MTKKLEDHQRSVIKLARAYINAENEFDIAYYKFGLLHAVKDLERFEDENG